MMNPISYRYTPSPPSIHTPMLFFTFLRLALCSRNNKYSIRHLFLLNSSLHKILSSLHIFVHHCTFCASLHTRTSPGQHQFYHSIGSVGLMQRSPSRIVYKTACTMARLTFK